MSAPLSAEDLASTLDLADHLGSFHNSAFPDSSPFLATSVENVRFWSDHAKPFLNIIKTLGTIGHLIPDLNSITDQLATFILTPVSNNFQILSPEWIADSYELCSRTVNYILERILSDIKADSRSFTSEQTQVYFRNLREIAICIQQLSNYPWPGEVVHAGLDEVYTSLRYVLTELSSLALKRLKIDQATAYEPFTSAALQMVEDDFESLRLLGYFVTKLDAFAVQSYKLEKYINV